MATADGVMDFDDEDEGHGQSPEGDRPEVTEPTVLPVDFPGPVRWDSVLGPGGEDLGDGLVPLDGPLPAAGDRDAAPPDGRRRPRSGPRPGRARPAAARTASRRRGFPAPTLRGVLASTGLAGLAAIMVTVVLAFDGATPPGRDGRQRATALDVPGSTRPAAAGRIDAPTQAQDRIDRVAQRKKGAVLKKRELARERERQRRAQAAPRSAPVTTEVVASPPPTPEPARDPWPGVSPAEREFTPGPWNLS